MGRVPNIAGVTVDIIEATGHGAHARHPGASSPVSPFSTFDVSFVVSGTPTSSSLTIDDSDRHARRYLQLQRRTFNSPAGISLSNTATQSGGVTIMGSGFSDTYDALGSKTGEPVNFVGNAGTNTVNVGSSPSTPPSAR